MGSTGNLSNKTPKSLYRQFIEGQSYIIHEATESDKQILDKIFTPAKQDMKMYKGISVTENDLDNLDNIITSYSSTTEDKRVATDYAYRAYDIGEEYLPLIANIKVKKGTPIADARQILGNGGMKGYEKETTIGRNVKYKYSNLKKHTDKYGDEYYTVDVEVMRKKKGK